MLHDFHLFLSPLNEDEQQEVAEWTKDTLVAMVKPKDKPSTITRGQVVVDRH